MRPQRKQTAMALNKLQKQKLGRLVRDDVWDILVLALDEQIVKIQSEKVTGSNDFETLRMLHTNQGKVDGLKEFFNKVETDALNYHELD